MIRGDFLRHGMRIWYWSIVIEGVSTFILASLRQTHKTNLLYRWFPLIPYQSVSPFNKNLGSIELVLMKNNRKLPSLKRLFKVSRQIPRKHLVMPEPVGNTQEQSLNRKLRKHQLPTGLTWFLTLWTSADPVRLKVRVRLGAFAKLIERIIVEGKKLER